MKHLRNLKCFPHCAGLNGNKSILNVIVLTLAERLTLLTETKGYDFKAEEIEKHTEKQTNKQTNHGIAQLVNNLPAMQETPVRFLCREALLEKGKATHSSILAWRIPPTVQSMGLQRVGHY